MKAMINMNIEDISNQYVVRKIQAKDIPQVLALCEGNPQYYRYCLKEISAGEILADMHALPAGKSMQDKYYIGYYDADRLVAVMDLVDHYPRWRTVWIGFFMMEKSLQGKGIGTQIISDLVNYLKRHRYQSVGLAWIKGNMQAEHFWHANGFRETGKIRETDGYAFVVAERKPEWNT